MSLQSMVRTYIINCGPRAKEGLAWFMDQASLAEAIRTAALALDSNGKRNRHFRRTPKTSLQQGYDVLEDNEERIKECKDFDELHGLVEEWVGPFKGLGELYVYDTSFRIGAKLGFLPTKVYLHAGTRRGARALGLDFKAKALEVADLPEELQELEPREIEDLLCIFEESLKGAAADDTAGESPAAPGSCFPLTSKGCA